MSCLHRHVQLLRHVCPRGLQPAGRTHCDERRATANDAVASLQCCCCGVVTELVLMLLCSCCPSACLCVSWLSLPPARIGTHSWACAAASLHQALDNAGVDLQQHNMQQVTFDFCLVNRHALLRPSWTRTANH